MQVKQIIERLKSNPLFPNLLSILGGLLYLVQSWYYAHTQVSILDEGSYLLKGYLFATGKYWPFQDYGPWTNHMPLSFLIPGWVERIFGPGLRTGRYLAVFLGLLMVLGVWLISKRFGNLWWSALIVWLLALNVPTLKVYSVMTSQGLVACMLVWVLFFTLGPDRADWQVYLGVTLAGLLLLTRINMAPIIPLLLLYIFWEYGKVIGIRASAVTILVIGIGYAIFWPGILKLWAAWLPEGLVPFISSWGKPADAVHSWNSIVDFRGRLMSFFLGVRIHFFSLMAVVISVLIGTRKQFWHAASRFKIAVFLLVSYVFLFGFHAWASLFNDYCVFCFQNYLMFFQVIGLLLANVLFTSLNEYRMRAGKWLTPIIGLVTTAGIVFSLINEKQLINTLSGRWLVNTLTDFLNMDIPRFRSQITAPGKMPLWVLFSNKFGWHEDQILDFSIYIFFILLIVLSWLLLYWGISIYKKRWVSSKNTILQWSYLWFVLFLMLGTIFTYRIGFLPVEYDCGWDVIASYERAGAHLAKTVPPGSTIYWKGGLSAVPLLYLTDYELFPPQINNRYSYRIGGDPEALIRYGWWNDQIARQWSQDADIFLVEAWRVGDEGDTFDELMPTPPLLPCKRNTEIHIYVRE